MDLAVGFIVGAAFTTLVKSMVTNLFMPPLGLLVGDIDFSQRYLVLSRGSPPGPYQTLAEAQEAGAVTLNYGLFLEETLAFVLVAFAVFLMVRGVNRMEKRRQNIPPEEPTTRECPFCVSVIPLKARRCPSCTSEIPETA